MRCGAGPTQATGSRPPQPGCPYSLIYSARHTIERFAASGRGKYLDRILVTGVDQPEGQSPTVRGLDLGTGRETVIEADRVYLAAGGLGSTRIVLNSLASPPGRLDLHESVQFLVPFVSLRSTGDPRPQSDFTLNQFNLVLQLDDEGRDLSQLHFYTFNQAFLEALPGPLRRPAAEPIRKQLLRRLSVAIGYLPSWASPTFQVTVLPLWVQLAVHETNEVPFGSLSVTFTPAQSLPPWLKTLTK